MSLQLKQMAKDMNLLARFCGKRDLPELTQAALFKEYGIRKVDVMVLFGGSILCGGDVLAEAMKQKIAAKFVIVGGAGHTTETLRCRMHEEYPDLETEGLSEAEVFNSYLKNRYGLQADYLECRSTNCGNNITYLLELLKEQKVSFQSILICQDATMQYRMEAGLRKQVGDKVQIINYAAYAATVTVEKEQLTYTQDIWGMWDMDRYLMLLLGEIPRLTDDENGYGPKGSAYIAHVDIPNEVRGAFEELKEEHGELVRVANPSYASCPELGIADKNDN